MQEDPQDNKYTMYDAALICLNRVHNHDVAIEILELLAATPKYISYYDLNTLGDKIYALFDKDKTLNNLGQQATSTVAKYNTYKRLTKIIIDKKYVSYDIYKVVLNVAEQYNRVIANDNTISADNAAEPILDHIGVE